MIDGDLLDEISQDKTLRSICFPEEPMLWCDFYFCDSFWTPQDYEEILEWIENGGNLIWFWYRGCAKTSIIRKMICKWVATRKKKFVRWTSYDVSKAEDNITSISNMMIGSETSMFVNDYWRLYYWESSHGVFKQKEQKRTSWFTTTNGVMVKANSVKKSTRWLNVFMRDQSLRPDLDVLDDIDDDENTANPITIKKTYNKVKGAIFGWATGQKIILGNTINEDWVLPRLAEDYKNNKKWKIVYTKLIDDGKIHRPERFVWKSDDADKINKTLPPESHVVSIDALRDEQWRDWFGANYLLVPLRNDVPIIEEQWIRYEQYVPITYWHKTYISIDSWESEKDWSDPIGVTIATWMPEKRKFNVRHSEQLKWRQKDPIRIEERLEFLYKKFWVEALIIENKAWGMTLRKNLIRKFWWMIFLYDPLKMTKVMRLRQCQPYIEWWHVLFSPDIDQGFIKEMIKFPNVEHDDRVDSFTQLLLKHKILLQLTEKDVSKSIESPTKNTIPNQNSASKRTQELIEKYSPKKQFFTKDF